MYELPDKTEWIEINLPWYTSYDASALQLDRRKINEEVKRLSSDVFSSADLEDLNREFEFDEVDKIKHSYPVFTSKVEHDNTWLRDVLDTVPDDRARLLARRWVMVRKYRIWSSKLSMWDSHEALAESICSEWRSQHFSDSPACRPGTLIEVKHKSGEIKQYLLGDVNILGGMCDDCCAFNAKDIVLRYTVLIPNPSPSTQLPPKSEQSPSWKPGTTEDKHE